MLGSARWRGGDTSARSGCLEAERNTQQVRVTWRFTTYDARIKLKRLYPVLEKQC